MTVARSEICNLSADVGYRYGHPRTPAKPSSSQATCLGTTTGLETHSGGHNSRPDNSAHNSRLGDTLGSGHWQGTAKFRNTYNKHVQCSLAHTLTCSLTLMYNSISLPDPPQQHLLISRHRPPPGACVGGEGGMCVSGLLNVVVLVVWMRRWCVVEEMHVYLRVMHDHHPALACE